MAGALLVIGLAVGLTAGCGSSGDSGDQSGGDGCSITETPTDSGGTYTVTLQGPSGDAGYYAQTASVTISGGVDEPSASSVPLNSAVPLTGGSGTFNVRATIATTSSAPSTFAPVSCSIDVYVN
jgi:hypothetical protein